MGFKLPGIKKAGSSLENLDLNIKTRFLYQTWGRNDYFFESTIPLKTVLMLLMSVLTFMTMMM